jgi:hypothetical protein
MSIAPTTTRVEPFFIDPSYLENLLESGPNVYQQAQPYPHIAFDDFLPEEVLENVLSEFPLPGQIRWNQYTNDREKKLEANSELNMGPNTRLLLRELNSSIFLTFLEKLTGIEGLIPDPHYVGGGIHQIQRDGFLKVHTDFNRHTRLKLDRRLNVLIYLNKHWEESYGGHFEMWNADMTEAVRRVLPIFNRCVIFSTTDFSYHGHPNPLTCPEGWTRKSIALYYYSNGRPAREITDAHSTVFRARPGEQFSCDTPRISWKELARKFVPPIALEARRYLTGK